MAVMKILFITNLFYPDRAGGAAVHSDFCYRLQAMGHDVQVHAAYPYYPEWKNKTEANLWRRKAEVVNGIPVLRHGLHLPKRLDTTMGRVLQEITFFFSLLRSVFRGGRPDVVVAICPLMPAVAYAWLVAKLNRAKLWLNIEDIMSEAAQPLYARRPAYYIS